jgi:hypothetical protein
MIDQHIGAGDLERELGHSRFTGGHKGSLDMMLSLRGALRI